MKNLFLAIQARLLTLLNTDGSAYFAHTAMWNNQIERLLADKSESVAIQSPAAFVEFVGPLQIKELGNGVQQYEPLTVRIHYYHRQEDAGDGTLDQNLTVFDVKDAGHKLLQMFKPQGAVELIRYQETPDYNHDNVYHFYVDYRTNYIEYLMNEPVDPATKVAPTNAEIDITIQGSTNTQPSRVDNILP